MTVDFEILKIEEEDSIGIRIKWAGDLFQELVDLFHLGCLSFHSQYEIAGRMYSKIWVGTKIEAYSILEEFEKIVDVRLSKEIWDYATPTPETKFVRGIYDPSLIEGKPLGDFQVRGIRRGISQSRFYLAWEMRLGKTYVTIGILNHRIAQGEVDRVLFVLPPEALYTVLDDFWKFQKMGATKENTYVANVYNRSPFQEQHKFVFMTYNTFRVLSDEFYKKSHKGKASKNYRKPPFPFGSWGTCRAIVLDEVHTLRTRSSRIVKLLFLHKHFFEYRYLLSGTPSPNRVEQFYSQLKFMDESIIPKSYLLWIKSIANVGNQWDPYCINRYYPDKLGEFYSSIQPWVSREFTKGNLSTPEALVKTIFCPMSPKQEKIYQALVETKLMKLKETDGGLIPSKVKDKFPYFMQALEDPSRIVVEDKLNPKLMKLLSDWKFEDNSKLEVCDSLLEKFIEDEEKKVIIWSGHPKTMDSLAIRYQKYKPVIIHGSLEIDKTVTVADYRHTLLNAFKTDPHRKLLIASYLTTSASVNIREASRMIYFDRSWDLVYWLQSKKRADSHLNTDPVQIYPLVIRNSLDAYQNAVLSQRADLNDNMFSLNALSPATWKALFAGDESNFKDKFFGG